MAKIVVKLNIPTLYNAHTAENSLKLMPGVNEVEEKIWEEFEAHPLVQVRIEKGEITVIKPKLNKSPVKNESAILLSKFSPKEAEELVNETVDRKLLDAWQKSETRKPLLGLIAKRLKVLDDVKFRETKDGEEKSSNQNEDNDEGSEK